MAKSDQQRPAELPPAEKDARKEFLLELGDRLRATADAAEVKAIAAKLVAIHLGLGADRVGYREMDETGEAIRVVAACAGPTVPLSAFGHALADELRAGRTVCVHDSGSDPRASGDEAAEQWAARQMSAVIAVPLIRQARLVAFFFVIDSRARAWTDGEVQLIQDVAERTWEAVERARAEAALRKSEERMREIADAMPVLISSVGADLRFRFVNQLYCEWFGRPREEIIGRHLREVMGEEVFKARQPHFNRALRGEHVTHEVAFPMNPPRQAVVQHIPHFDEDGRVIGLYSLVQEVTEQKRVEAELRHSRDELATVLDTVPAAIFIATDPSCDVVRVNRHGAEWFQMDPDGNASMSNPAARVRHLKILDFNGREVPAEELPVQRAARGKPSTRHELRVAFADGTFIDLLGNAAPLLGGNGEIRGAVAAFVDVGMRKRAEDALREETRTLETLNRTGAALAAELDLERLVQMITDAGVEVTGASVGAFLYRMLDGTSDEMLLYTLSGVERAKFEHLGAARATDLFHPTFTGKGMVRSDDILADPRYGLNPPHNGMPEGHLPVRSYLAVPVISRNGETIGSLLFGHPETHRFSERHERLMAGIAAQAAIAIDNAHLYGEAQREIEHRKRAEDHQRLLIAELNHRVKNTLAIVQGVAQQTFRECGDMDEARRAFEGRLAALASAHNVLTRQSWEHAKFTEIVEGALAPFHLPADGRAVVRGEDMRIEPKTAVSLAMAFHELATNAVKYGAWSNETGRVAVEWRVAEGEDGPRLQLVWREEGGPPVAPRRRKGFGSRMVERSLAAELGGSVTLVFDRAGIRCEIDAPLPPAPQPEAMRPQENRE
jgi:PAS domain S-box-containing protein